MTSLATRKMVYRILDQYKNAPKFVTFIEAIGARLDDTDTIIDHLLFGRFLETAENFELDRIGQLLGYPRPYQSDPSVIFTYKSASNPVNEQSKGYGSIYDPAAGGKYSSLGGLDSGTPETDAVYRELLFTRSKVLNTGPSIPELYTWITESFGIGCTITVPDVMHIRIQLDAAISVHQRNMIEYYGPTLPGVNILITNWE
jgi:hypothetical protein